MRKNTVIATVSLFILSWGAVHCSSPSQKVSSPTAKASGSWSDRMRGMAASLDELMPYVFSRQEYRDPDNRPLIKKKIAEFSESVEVVPQHAGEVILGKDPMVKFLIQRLRTNTHHAQKAFDEGHVEFSRNILRENMGLCFSCHSATDLGPQNRSEAKFSANNFRILASEKADFYVATRQYDRAVDLLEGVLKNPGSSMDDPHEQVANLRKYLSLEVRVKRDPARAASLLENFLTQGNLPYFVATDAETWLKSIRDWQKEKKGGRDQFGRALALIRKAKAMQSSSSYHSSYVEYLRA